MADLKTNYKDDVLDTSVNEKRKFNMIQNSDGTVSFEDVTEYTQTGDSFGAADINATNAAVNKANSNLARITNLQPNTEIKVGTFDGKDLYRKIIIKDFKTSAVSGTIHMFDETILSENVISINGICQMVEDNTSNVIPNNKMLLNINSAGKIYATFTQDWTTSTYTWRYKLDVLYTK